MLGHKCLFRWGVRNWASQRARYYFAYWYRMGTLAASQKLGPGTQFVVASDVMRKFIGMAERVAKHVGTVLIVGETGTGKERIAHAIHEYSQRCKQPFVDINCAALPENLVESELFGYEKGAFSGADSAKPGLFELANLGTIFLDEIGELDLKVQVKLLRVLDRAPYYRLGGHRKITADARVIAATNRDLKEEVRAGRFRKDLYHRLSQFELCVPPLRNRPEDIVALAEHFLTREGTGLKFSKDAMRVLESYSWPGNVRELQNVVNKVVVSAQGSEIGVSEVRQELAKTQSGDGEQLDIPQADISLDGMEAQAIAKALQKTGGHRGRAAVQLGISRRTLSRKLRQYGLSSARPSTPGALGSMSPTEQRNFRATTNTPAMLMTTDGQEVTCTVTNLSARGMGVEGFAVAVRSQSELRVRFRFSDSDTTIEAVGRLAWVGSPDRAGITFTDVDQSSRREITRWLYQKMAEEGWILESQALEKDLVQLDAAQ